MIIKFSDNFDSIFYAVLYSNLTGYYLSSKNEIETCLIQETEFDIDKIDWQELLTEHDKNFGTIKWIALKDEYFLNFKDTIENAFRHWKPFKYKIIIESIRQAFKFGLLYINNEPSSEFMNLLNLSNQVQAEARQSIGYISFTIAANQSEKFLIGSYHEENQIGDIIIKNLSLKYCDYQILLKTPRFLYFLYRGKDYKLPTSQFKIDIDSKSLEDFFKSFYNKYFASGFNFLGEKNLNLSLQSLA